MAILASGSKTVGRAVYKQGNLPHADEALVCQGACKALAFGRGRFDPYRQHFA